LKDHTFVGSVKTIIEDTLKEYAATPYNPDSLGQISRDDIQFTISDQLLLETLLMNIRGKSISFASWKKKENEQLENELQVNIVNLENKIQIQYSDTLEKQLRENNNKLENLRKLKMQGVKKHKLLKRVKSRQNMLSV
jgi:hypothetical protein